jgi:hypothetical protein
MNRRIHMPNHLAKFKQLLVEAELNHMYIMSIPFDERDSEWVDLFTRNLIYIRDLKSACKRIIIESKSSALPKYELIQGGK